MKTRVATIALLLLLLPLAAACQPEPVIPVTGASTPSLTAVRPEQQSTISALQTYLASTSFAPATVTPNLNPTGTPAPTQTFTPSLIPPTFTPSLLPSAAPRIIPTSILAAGGCNQAQFVTDLSIPDGTLLSAGQSFVKSWRLRNSGTCTWSPNYKIVSIDNNPFGGPRYSNLGISIAPGNTIDLSLILTAPAAAGDYTGYFTLQAPDGNFFGVGANGSAAFDVSVTVSLSTPIPPLAVTHVDLSVNAASVNANCPPGYSFIFSAKILANAPGDISFHWTFSDGSSTAQQTIHFSAAGSQTASAAWSLGASGALPANPYAGTASLYIDNPNHQTFGAQPIAISCLYPTPTPR